jgi:hypothetical protein
VPDRYQCISSERLGAMQKVSIKGVALTDARRSWTRMDTGSWVPTDGVDAHHRPGFASSNTKCSALPLCNNLPFFALSRCAISVGAPTSHVYRVTAHRISSGGPRGRASPTLSRYIAMHSSPVRSARTMSSQHPSIHSLPLDLPMLVAVLTSLQARVTP